MYFLSKWFRSSETAISVQFILNISNPPLYIMRLLLNSIPSYLVNFFQLVAQTRFSRDSRPGVLDQGVFIGNIEINGKTSFRPSHVPVDNIYDWNFSLLVIIMLEIYNLVTSPSPSSVQHSKLSQLDGMILSDQTGEIRPPVYRFYRYYEWSLLFYKNTEVHCLTLLQILFIVKLLGVATVSQCYSVTVLQCYSVTVLQCYSITVSGFFIEQVCA